MANFANLKAAINAVIKQNGQGEITGEVMNQVLTAMVNTLGDNYQFAGVATPSTNPGTPDQNVFYMATQAGTYTNFSAIVLQAGISILLWDGSWSSETFFTVDSVPTSGSNNFITSGAVFDKFLLDGGAYDVTAHNNNATFADLSALLNSENLNTLIPVAVRHGGMSIKFVQTSDNKYVQYRLMALNFTANTAMWQGVDDAPTASSNNLVESGGVIQDIYNVNSSIYKQIVSYTINSSNVAVLSNIVSAFIVCVSGYSSLAIKKGNYSAYIAFLKTSNLVHGESPDFCDGENGRREITADSTLVIPNDCNYIWCLLSNSTFDYTPHLFEVDGVSILDDIANLKVYFETKIQQEKERATGAEAIISSTFNNKVDAINTNLNPIVTAVNSLGWTNPVFLFKEAESSHADFNSNIVLSQDGDSIEFTLISCSYRDFNDANYKGYAFTQNPNNASKIGIGVTRTALFVRSDDSTWIFQSYNLPSLVGKTIKIAYADSNIYLYADNELISTYSGQKTITLSSLGNGSTYGYWDGSIRDLKINGEYFDLQIDSTLHNVSIINTNSFLSKSEKNEINEASLADMYVEKTSDSVKIYKKLNDSFYVCYPLNYRYKTYTQGQYPSLQDNWGIWQPYIAEYIAGVMINIENIFNIGESEVALNVPRGDGESGNVYVGGGAHGFETIKTGVDGREFSLLIDNILYGETSVIPLRKANTISITQGSELYQAYTNSNPFAYVTKRWKVSEDKNLEITSEVKLLRNIHIVNGALGMFCVYRHEKGDSTKPYLTSRAIKGNHPYHVYEIEDGWESLPENNSLRIFDKDCEEITEYGNLGLGFSLKIKNANTKDSGGMDIGTNNSVYNKIYYMVCNNYDATTDEVLKATQEWSIEGSYVAL